MEEFKSLLDLVIAFPDEQSCIDYLTKRRWPKRIISPFNEDSKVYTLSGNKYKCSATNKYFNVKTGTIFENTKLPLRTWFMGLYLFSSHKRGISSYQLASDLKITQKSAWFMLGRLRFAFEHSMFMKPLDGIVQADETFVGGKNRFRHADKKVKYTGDREFSDKSVVWGATNEEGIVRCVVIPNTKNKTISPLVNSVVEKGAILVTDEWHGYKTMAENYHHEVVEHGRKQYLNESGFTTNKIESFWAHFKRTLGGTYIKVSRKHLQRYCTEITFRFNTRQISVQERFDMVLANCEGRLDYEDLTLENKTKFNY